MANISTKKLSDMVAKRESVDAMLEKLRAAQKENNFPTLKDLLDSYVAENCDDDRIIAERLLNSISGLKVIGLVHKSGRYNATAMQGGRECKLWIRKKDDGTWVYGAGTFEAGILTDDKKSDEEE